MVEFCSICHLKAMSSTHTERAGVPTLSDSEWARPALLPATAGKYRGSGVRSSGCAVCRGKNWKLGTSPYRTGKCLCVVNRERTQLRARRPCWPPPLPPPPCPDLICASLCFSYSHSHGISSPCCDNSGLLPTPLHGAPGRHTCILRALQRHRINR